MSNLIEKVNTFKVTLSAQREFEQVNPELIGQYKALLDATEQAREEIKTQAKNDVKVTGDDFEEVLNGVKVKAYKKDGDKYHVNKLSTIQLAKVFDLGVLSINNKEYKIAMKEGNVPNDIDSLCREQRFTYASKVELA